MYIYICIYIYTYIYIYIYIHITIHQDINFSDGPVKKQIDVQICRKSLKESQIVIINQIRIKYILQ